MAYQPITMDEVRRYGQMGRPTRQAWSLVDEEDESVPLYTQEQLARMNEMIGAREGAFAKNMRFIQRGGRPAAPLDPMTGLERASFNTGQFLSTPNTEQADTYNAMLSGMNSAVRALTPGGGSRREAVAQAALPVSLASATQEDAPSTMYVKRYGPYQSEMRDTNTSPVVDIFEDDFIDEPVPAPVARAVDRGMLASSVANAITPAAAAPAPKALKDRRLRFPVTNPEFKAYFATQPHPSDQEELAALKNSQDEDAIIRKASLVARNASYHDDFPEFRLSDDGSAVEYTPAGYQPQSPLAQAVGRNTVIDSPVMVDGVEYANPEAAREKTNRNLGFISVGNEPLSVDPMFDVDNSEEYGVPVETLDARRYGQVISKGQFDGRGNLYPTETVPAGNMPADIARIKESDSLAKAEAASAQAWDKYAQGIEKAKHDELKDAEKKIFALAAPIGGRYEGGQQYVQGIATLLSAASGGQLIDDPRWTQDKDMIRSLIEPIAIVGDPEGKNPYIGKAAVVSVLETLRRKGLLPKEADDNPNSQFTKLVREVFADMYGDQKRPMTRPALVPLKVAQQNEWEILDKAAQGNAQ